MSKIQKEKIEDNTELVYDNSELFDADPNCKHEVVDAPGGGVKCKKCPGWYCL